MMALGVRPAATIVQSTGKRQRLACGFGDLRMASEFYFRLVLGMVILLTTIVTVYHRLKAKSGEKISRQKEGYLFAIVLRLAGLMLFVVTIAYLISPPSVQWAMIAIPIPIRWCGAVAGLFSSVLMYWTLSNLGKNLTDTVVTRANATLVTSGPYRWVRHPFYFTTALVMFSVFLLTANWLIGVACFAVLFMLAIRTPKEEQVLIERFGQQYLDYMATTGRFIPRIKSK
jgi:protein-S-isoprenylcysteine O-methyltransferase Ste14